MAEQRPSYAASMETLDTCAKMNRAAPSAGAFVDIRDPRTLRLLARYNPTTREIELIDSRRERHLIDLTRYEPPAT